MFPAFLLWLIVVLIIVGLILWLLQQLPIDAQIKQIIRVVMILVVVIWLIWFLAGSLPFPRR